MESQAVTQLILSSPHFLLGVVAIFIAVVRLRRHPVVSTLTIAAFVTLFASIVLSVLNTSWLIYRAEQGLGAPSMGQSLIGIIPAFLNFVFVLMLTIAVFTGRKQLSAPSD